MAIVGTFGLILAFGAAIFTMVVGAIGGHQRSKRYAELSHYGLMAATGGVITATAALLFAFITHDFSLPYVYGRSDLRMPLQYVTAAFWGGQEGSLLFWVFMTSTFGATAAAVNRNKLPTIMPYFHAIMAASIAALLFILVFVSNPFDTFLVLDIPVDGKGLNPLLQNPLMVIHPPCLLSGFATFAVPFAFAMAALLARDKGAEWLRATRKWTLISWLFLSVGNILGGMWAYQELGWGGYWAWDPVENAAIIPWFMSTAYLHSVIIQEQRGMFRRWNAILVASSFLLTILGTWMTRSGLIQSVHTFAESEIGDYFFAILCAWVAFSVYVIATRWKGLESDHQIESPASREGAFMLNNWALVGLAFVVLWGTLFPRFKEMATGESVAIGPAWFNQFTAPIGLTLLGLMALGVLLPWRRVTKAAMRRNFTFPAVGTVILVPMFLLTWYKFRGEPLGMEVFSKWAAMSILGITLIVLNSLTLAVEFYRGIRARMRATGAGPINSLFDLMSRHRRRYGGYLVHVGMVMIFLAFCGNVGKVDRDVTLVVGQTAELGDYTIRFDAVQEHHAIDKVEITADMTVFRNGREIATIHPARYDFNDYAMLAGEAADPMKVTSEIAIRSTPLEDLYIALLQVNEDEQAAAFKMVVLPFTWWFWFGGVVLIAGTLVCMWPEHDRLARQYWRHRAARRAEAVIVAALVGLPIGLFGGQMEAFAQEGPPEVAIEDHPEAPHDHADHETEPSELSQELTGDQLALVNDAFSMVMTTCSGCAGKSLSTASPSCYPSNQDKTRIRNMAAEGMTLDAILGTFVSERGEAALAVPPDGGFNRLAWLVPSCAAIFGVWLIIGWTRKWSKPSPEQSASASTAPIDGYMGQLEDELAARG